MNTEIRNISFSSKKKTIGALLDAAADLNMHRGAAQRAAKKGKLTEELIRKAKEAEVALKEAAGDRKLSILG